MDRLDSLAGRGGLPTLRIHKLQCGAKHPNTSYRCRKFFSVRAGTVMQNPNLSAQKWVIEAYMLRTNLGTDSSMKMHRDLDITQKSAWHLAHRIRETRNRGERLFGGPVKIDETYIGGKRKNKPNHVYKELTGCGPDGKTVVVGAKNHASNKVAAKVVELTTKKTLQVFVKDYAELRATVYTDEAVTHSVSEYIRGHAQQP